MKTIRYMMLCAAVLVAFVAMASNSQAQVDWMNPVGDKGFSVMILKGALKDAEGIKFPTSLWTFTARLPMPGNLSFVTQFPVSHLSAERSDWVFDGSGYTYYTVDKNETQFGNLYLGMETVGELSSPMAEFGAWLPLAQDNKYDAAEYGMLTAFDRFEAFGHDLLTLSGKFGYRYKNTEVPAITFKILAGPSYMIPDRGDAELFADYNFDVWVRSEQFGVGFGFTGRAIITESDLSFGERTTHQAGVAADVTLGQMRLGGTLRLPLDSELSDAVSATYGLSLSFDLK
jgi:hypothetical protein